MSQLDIGPVVGHGHDDSHRLKGMKTMPINASSLSLSLFADTVGVVA